jgi:hypothetical protein
LLLCVKECKILKNCCYDYKTRTEDRAMHTKEGIGLSEESITWEGGEGRKLELREGNGFSVLLL